MKIKDFLKFISDEEVRIELQIDIESEDDYLYTSFWFSDYRKAENFEYAEWIIESISFVPVMYSEAQISIQIKEK